MKTSDNLIVQFGFLGMVVTYWNELEARVRSILVLLSPDPLTAAMLAADLQIGTLINVTRMMARERKWMSDRINAKLRKSRKRVKLYEPFLEHVEHFLDCVDILREHRNYYIHNAHAPENARTLEIQKISARGKVSFASDIVQTSDLANLSKTINEFMIYSDRLLAALEKNESKTFSLRPTWPRKPPLPERLKTHHLTLQDVAPLLQSFPSLFRSRFQRRFRALSKERLSEKT